MDFWCVNYDKLLIPVINPEDVIALKKPDSWKEYIPGNFICIFVTKSYKILARWLSSRKTNSLFQSFNWMTTAHLQCPEFPRVSYSKFIGS
ncbi:MAG: hypothetical protein IJ647_08655 [Prevotella sp.]|nr:hypothetical protein [Prevotella sp.]